MRTLLVTLAMAAFAWNPACAEDAGIEDAPPFRSLREPEQIFAAPQGTPASAAGVSIVDLTGDDFVAEPTEELFVPPVPSGPPVPLQGHGPPRPYSFRLNDNGLAWIPADGDRLGIFSIGGPAALVFDEPHQVGTGLGLGVHFLDGPSRTDLPPRLFDLSVAIGWRDEIDRRWAYEVVVIPGIYADFEGSARDGVRILGHGIVWYQHSDETLWGLGIVSLDRETISVLPVAGVVHQPNDHTRLELIFPRPKLARRITSSEGLGGWVYVAGEYGGGSWAIERVGGRAHGRDDVLTLNDRRLLLGIEWLGPEAPLGSFFEVGYVFDREVRYRSRRGNYDPGDAIMLRMGSRF